MAHPVNSWKQSGNISLWRYTENQRNYPDWHLNADTNGCASLIALLDVLTEEGPDAYRTVKVTPPNQAQLAVPNNHSGRAAWQAPEKLRLSLSTDDAAWIFPSQSNPAILVIGSDWLAPLRKGIKDILFGRGDYSIGNNSDDNLRLWFWW